MYIRRKRSRNRRNSRLFVLKLILTAIIGAFVLLFIYFEHKVDPLMYDFTIIKGKSMMSELFSNTVSEKMEELNLTYDKLMNVTYSESGEVRSLSTDIVSVNKLKNQVTADLTQLFQDYYEYAVDVPIGSVTGSEFLSGLGFTVELNSVVTGGVTSEFRSEFESAGVNQTIHRLYIDITGDLVVIVGGEQEPINLTTSVLVGETVLVGEVPRTYVG